MGLKCKVNSDMGTPGPHGGCKRYIPDKKGVEGEGRG